jgi:hypothetical protein
LTGTPSHDELESITVPDPEFEDVNVDSGPPKGSPEEITLTIDDLDGVRVIPWIPESSVSRG